MYWSDHSELKNSSENIKTEIYCKQNECSTSLQNRDETKSFQTGQRR